MVCKLVLLVLVVVLLVHLMMMTHLPPLVVLSLLDPAPHPLSWASQVVGVLVEVGVRLAVV
jgi:hypothetical protein